MQECSKFTSAELNYTGVLVVARTHTQTEVHNPPLFDSWIFVFPNSTTCLSFGVLCICIVLCIYIIYI